MKNYYKNYLIIVFVLVSGFFMNGCYVGSRVNLTASQCNFPVSYTNNFHDSINTIVNAEDYEILEEFTYEFTKWGIAEPINVESEEDISEILNERIKINNADAIVDLKISVSSPGFNGLFLFTKIVSLFTASVTIPFLIAEPKTETAILAAGSVIVYLFTPAASLIKIEGKVVKIIK